MQLSEQIRRLRKEKGLSQEQLAMQLGVSRQTVSKWELGDAVPDTVHIVLLSQIFGVTTDQLLHNEIKQQTSQSKTRFLSAKAEKLVLEKGYWAGIYLIAKDLVGVIGGTLFAFAWISVLSTISPRLSDFPVQAFILPIAAGMLSVFSLIRMIVHLILTIKLKKLDHS